MLNYWQVSAESAIEQAGRNGVQPPPGPDHIRNRSASMADNPPTSALPMAKECRRCAIIRPPSEFWAGPRNKDGLTSWCKECMRWSNRRHYYRNQEKRKAYAAEWTRQNPERARQTRRKRALKSYGLDAEAFRALSAEQNNACAICLVQEELVIDHCHETGVVRGLLCQRCNKGIGLLAENPTVILRAAAYVRK